MKELMEKVAGNVTAKKTPAKKAVKKVAAKKATAKSKVNPLLNSLIQADNVALTENGAKTFKSTLNATLDLFAMGAALRTRGEQDIINLFVKANAEDSLLALKCLFHIRNVRGGAGERRTFRIVLKYLGDKYPDMVKKNISNIVHFGRFDDLFELFGTRCENDALNFIAANLESDLNKMESKESVSLCGKWMPSLNASSKVTKARGLKIQKFLGVNERTYRKVLSALRAYSNVVEVAMSSGDWTKIDYSKIPSKASLLYRGAFKKHDPSGYQAFLDAVQKGEKKINASALFPYEIFEKVREGAYRGSKDAQTLDALWDALPNYMEESDRNILVMADASGSMTGRPMDVAFSLAVYTAERNSGPFAGYFISYSDTPTLHKVVGKTLTEKFNSLAKTYAYSTDLQAAFEMILKHAVKVGASQEDMPEQVAVITDVEFNSSQNGKTNLESLKDKYRAAGYEMPQLIFWNVNSVKNNVPATADEKGVLLVSGCSPSVFTTLLSGKQYTPVDQMIEVLSQEIYNRVIV